MKRLFLCSLFLLIMLSFFGLCSRAQASEILSHGQCGKNVTWTLADDGTLTISGTGEMDDFGTVFPNVSPWFFMRDSITHVVIEYGVTSIGNCAFNDCKNLISISIPESVITVGELAFGNCADLTQLFLPDSVATIGGMAFSRCVRLTEIHLPKGLRIMMDNLFFGCSALQEIEIPGNVTYIGRYAFSLCSSLTELTIPDSVVEIGIYAFDRCRSLTSVNFGQSVSNIGFGAFQFCHEVTDITFWGSAPPTLETMFSRGWITAHYPKDDPSWTEERMQDYGATAIIWNAFDPLCSHIFDEGTAFEAACNQPGGILYTCSCGYHKYTYTAKPSAHKVISDTINPTCTEGGYRTDTCSICGECLVDIFLPATGHDYQYGQCTVCGEATPDGVVSQGICGSNLYWTLDDQGVLTIHGYGPMDNYTIAYHEDSVPWAQYRSAITQVVIEDGATSIGNSAFENCSALAAVSIPDSVTTIGTRAFKNCSNLKDLSLGNGIVTLKEEAFIQCKSLTFVTLPESLTTMEGLVFAQCKSLIGIRIPDSVPIIGRRMFYECSSLVYISMPDTLIGIDADTFYMCESLWHVFLRGSKEPPQDDNGSLSFYSRYWNMATKHYQCTGQEITVAQENSTCARPGSILLTCTLCNDIHPLSLPLAEHTWKNATCTEPATCLACNTTKGNPLGTEHNWDEGVVIQEPTADQVGIRQQTCKTCGEVNLEAIENLPADTGAEKKPMSGSTIFLLIIVSLVVVMGGTGLVVYFKQMKA